MMKRPSLHKILPAVVPAVALLVFMMMTSPSKLPLVLLVLPLILLFVSLYFGVFLSLKKLRSEQGWPGSNRLISLVVAVVPSILLILQSIGQLTRRDALLMCLLGGALIIYIAKLRPHF